MSTPTCRHCGPDGVLCRSRALPGGKYCYAHTRRALKAHFEDRARHRASGRFVPPLADPGTIQAALSKLANSVANETIDQHLADAVLYGLRLAFKELVSTPKP